NESAAHPWLRVACLASAFSRRMIRLRQGLSFRIASPKGGNAMVAAVRVHKNGGPEVLTYEDVAVPAPGPGQARVKNHACGLNFSDTYFRSGLYPSASGLPFISGNEAAGEVVAVGSGVTEVKVGDRVGYTSALGSYAAERIMPADRVVKLPDS